MTFHVALRVTEILLALAFIQQSVEHLRRPTDSQLIFLLRIACSLAVFFGLQTTWGLCGLCIISLAMLHRFDGPYNGGSDRMSLLVLWCLFLAQILPSGPLQEAALGYLAIQLVLSYFVSGWVKLVNPEWRTGRALRDVFAFSAYPVSESLRVLANRPTLTRVMSWAVMIFEVLFPISLVSQPVLIVALCVGAVFHLANACLFGLNRFLWIWLAAYPSILWFQSHLGELLS